MTMKGKVLIVDDKPGVADAIAGTYTCDRASDGWEAIEKLEHEDYAAIMIDTDLPLHSGFGVLTYLREENGDALQNVIVVTTSDRDDLRRKISDTLTIVTKDDAVAEITRVMSAE